MAAGSSGRTTVYDPPKRFPLWHRTKHLDDVAPGYIADYVELSCGHFHGILEVDDRAAKEVSCFACAEACDAAHATALGATKVEQEEEKEGLR